MPGLDPIWNSAGCSHFMPEAVIECGLPLEISRFAWIHSTSVRYSLKLLEVGGNDTGNGRQFIS